MMRKKVLVLLAQYPQHSQTYIHKEIDALYDQYDIDIVSMDEVDSPIENPHPYKLLKSEDEIVAHIQATKPEVIHTHWIRDHLNTVYKFAKRFDIPFTIRSHSFDVLWQGLPWKERIFWYMKYPGYIKMMNDDLCRGVLGFPFAVEILKQLGVSENKLVSCFPMIDYEMFYDTSPNGEGVMNLGAALPKKNFEEYIRFAASVPAVTFELYPIGYNTESIRIFNEKAGSPVTIHKTLAHEKMPGVYKQHQWLIYTASPNFNSVGWPLAAAEAMASGTGVCLPAVREDIKEYVGDAGIAYSSIDELREIIAKPVPKEMRARGFEQAKRSDIRRHIHLLTDLWR